MQPAHFPTTIDALNPEWTTGALSSAGVLNDAVVASLQAVPVGEQGQTSEVLRLNLSYEGGDGTEPNTLIAKLPSPLDSVRAVQRALGSYSREVCFYRDLGGESGIALPRCYVAELDEASGDFILLLEDMSPSRTGDLWRSNPSDVAQATEALAGMHARWWCDPTLRSHGWLPQHDDRQFHGMLGAAYKGALPVALEKYPEHFTGYLRDVAHLLAAHWDSWIGYRPADPFTLVHNDFHPKQIFFPGPDGGRFAVFDWQNVVSGRPTFDLSRLLLKGLRPADLRERKDELLERYHTGLVQSGVEVEFDAIAAEWRGSLLHTLAYTAFVLARTDVNELERAASERNVDFRQRLVDDLAESLEDNEVHEVLNKG